MVKKKKRPVYIYTYICWDICDFRYRQLQASMDSQVIELRSEIKRKSFDVEQSQVLYEDTIRKLKESQLEHEKVEKKLQVCIKSVAILVIWITSIFFLVFKNIEILGNG